MVDIPKGFKVVAPAQVVAPILVQVAAAPPAQVPSGFRIVSSVAPAIDEELPSFGIPGEKLPPTQTRAEREAAALERQGPGALARIGEAFAEPFRETEFGLAPETVEQFTQSPIDIVNTFNQVLIGGGVSAAFSLLQGVGAASESAIKGITQTLRETGVLDATTARKFERDATEIIDLGALQLGVSPGALRAAPRRARPPAAARQAEEQAERIARGRGLPVQVPLARGDITQDPNIQAFQDRALQGLEGSRAQALAQDFAAKQDVALRANVEAIQRQAAGRPLAAIAEEAGLGAERVEQAVKVAKVESKQIVRNAYDQAAKIDASVDGEALKAISGVSRQRLVEQGFDIAEMPKLTKRLDEIANLKLVDGKLSPATLNNIEVLRKRINKNIDSVKLSDPSEAAALGILKRDLDDHIDNVFDESLIRGNEQAVAVWKNARELSARFKRDFATDKTIRKIADEDLTQEETLNLLFGGSQMGFKTQAGKNIVNIKRILGENSDAFRSLKEEAILRLTKNQSDSTFFSGSKLNTAVEKALKNNQTLMRELFTKEELSDLRRLARVAKSVTEKQKSRINPSGSFIEFSRLTQGKFGFIGDIVKSVFSGVAEIRAGRRLERDLTIGQVVEPLRRDPELFRTAIAASIAAPEA